MTPTEAIAVLEKALEAGPTPGPWLANLFTSSFEIVTPGAYDKSMTLCTRYSYDEKASEMIANGMLIAAANPLAIRTLLDAHAGALRDAEALRDERDELTDVLHRGGFVRCDIAACNCGSWHARFGYPERFREFTEALEQHGVNLHAGKTALNLLNEALDELDAARAALAQHQPQQGEGAK